MLVVIFKFIYMLFQERRKKVDYNNMHCINTLQEVKVLEH